MKNLLLLFCILISSCSTMKPEECVGANWHDIGYNDALQGRTIWLKSRTEACAKVQLQPDTKAYLIGYRKGEKTYCTYQSGFSVGRTGHDKTKVCHHSPELAKPFDSGYEKGLEAYNDEQDMLERMYELQERLHSMRNNKS